VRELKWLREENNRLNKILAERDLEVEVMKEIQEKNGEPTRSANSGSVRDRARPQSRSGRLVMLDAAFWYPLSFSA
jgi:putative transposase